MGGAWEHGIFGGDPALFFIPQEGRHFFFYAGVADDLGISHLNENRPLSMFDEVLLDGYGSHFIGRTPVASGHLNLRIFKFELRERELVNKAGKITGIRSLFNKGEHNGANVIKILALSGPSVVRFTLGPGFTSTFNYFPDLACMGYNSLILLILKIKGLSLR